MEAGFALLAGYVLLEDHVYFAPASISVLNEIFHAEVDIYGGLATPRIDEFSHETRPHHYSLPILIKSIFTIRFHLQRFIVSFIQILTHKLLQVFPYLLRYKAICILTLDISICIRPHKPITIIKSDQQSRRNQRLNFMDARQFGNCH